MEGFWISDIESSDTATILLVSLGELSAVALRSHFLEGWIQPRLRQDFNGIFLERKRTPVEEEVGSSGNVPCLHSRDV
jgi:hypothetical protein